MSSRTLRRLGLDSSQTSSKLQSTTTTYSVLSSGENLPSASDDGTIHEEDIQANRMPKGNTFALVC